MTATPQPLTQRQQEVLECFRIAAKRLGVQSPRAIIKAGGAVPESIRRARLVLKLHLYRMGMDWHEIGAYFEVGGDSVRDIVNRHKAKIIHENETVLRALPVVSGGSIRFDL